MANPPFLSQGGDAFAVGGFGGDGGDGVPPGDRGDGGQPKAVAGEGNPFGTVLKEAPGKRGGLGADCPGPVLGPLVITGQTHPGGITLSLRNLSMGPVALADLQVVSDADGHYVFENVAPGDYQIIPDYNEAKPPLYWDPGIREVTKVAGVGIAGQDFTRKTGGQFRVTVHVQDQQGAPMEGIDTSLRGYDPARGMRFATTDGAGDAVYDDILSGLYRAFVDSPAPAGFEWSPDKQWVFVGDADVTAPAFRLVPK